jgi:hypothetical protein
MSKKLQILKMLLALALCLCGLQQAGAQTASVSVPVSVGRTTCGTGTRGVQEYNFNASTNILSNLNAICTPLFMAPGFSTALTGDAFNPADTSLYVVRAIYTSGVPTTYIWRYKMPGCPTGGLGVPVYRTFPGQDIAGITFDRAGNGYWLEYVGASAPYKLGIRRVNLVSGTISAFDTLSTSFNVYQLNGDFAMTPRGVMYAAFDNKMFTVDYTAWDGNPATKIPTTYIDTVKAPAGTNMVGLCYADGKMLTSYLNTSSAGCFFREVNLLNGDTSLVTYSGNTSAFDLTSIVSSLGLSKTLVSSTPTATLNQYDLEYQIKIQNLGNYPLDSLQVSDNLQTIYGPGNVTVTGVSIVTNPGTVFLNAAYNGTTVTNLFTNGATLATQSKLPAHPASNSICVISIRCRVSNIIVGQIYNNNAIGTIKGYRGTILRDISTDGNNSDPNTNDKADDPGESDPTPFFISVAPETPPCVSLDSVIYLQTYGTGTGITSVIPGTTKTQYTPYGTVPIIEERYAVTNNPINGNSTRWVSMSDHTGDANGRMLVVNADNLGNRIFFDTVNVACSRLKYSFFAWAAFIGNSDYQTFCNGVGGYKAAKLTFVARNATNGRIIANNFTGDITGNSWNQYGMKWVMPAGVTRVVLEIYNNGEGGCGNDIALDDVQFGLCDVLPTVSASGADGCIGQSTTFDVTLADTTGLSNFLTYQWQSASGSGGPWTDISGANSVNYTINPITFFDGKWYRLVVSNGSASCQFISAPFFLNLKLASTTPLSAVATKGTICPGESVSLRVNTGIIGTGASAYWYTGSCGGTLVGTGTTITVTPTVTTRYYVRMQGDCNTTSCRTVDITVNCDIDDDNDGIPDITENNGVDVEGDDDFDGIPNWRDSDMAGFTDANGDGVDDRYDFDRDGIINQYDRDSDNDGIPDVVESYGVDADGDGVIDNYTDTDADGFSQNVDANATGYLNSGNGLGRLDLDGDGYPNFLDLDSDNDGIPDIVEALRADTDNNGRVDGTFIDPDNDGFHSAVDGDADGNGISENSANALLRTGADIGGDGRADSYPFKNVDRDGRANPYDHDSDGDGLSDVLEMRYGQLKISGSTLFIDGDNNGQVDGALTIRGWNSAIASGGTAIAIPNNDADAYPDYLDIDADGDGITDNIEIQTTYLPGANYLLPGGADVDNDGIDDRYDSNTGSFGFPRLTAVDTDSDGTPDYLDLDSDADAQPDIIEGNDFNQNNINDDFISPAGVDSDGDGLDNTFDNDNSNPYVTSAQLGDGGSNTGPGAAGTRSTITRTLVAQYDRNWRFNGMILEVNLISFTGNLYANTAHLGWTLYAGEPIRSMVVERSLDGTRFDVVGQVAATGAIGIAQHYSLDDQLAGVAGNTYYYRLRITGVSNRQKLSNIVVLRRDDQLVKGVEVMPVPATSYFNVNIFSSSNTEATVELVDAQGKVVERKKQLVRTGSNVIGFVDVDRYGAGVYNVRVSVGGEVYNRRLIIK